MSVCEGMRVLDLGMSNFDHRIDGGLADALRAEPGKVRADYAGWNFHARVWFADEKFHAEVWTYGSPKAVLDADTLEALMEAVCAEWGDD